MHPVHASDGSPPEAVTARDAAAAIAMRLREQGHTAYFAGGCVRDRLLGLAPEDYDVATDAGVDRIRQLFPNARGVGEAFGVMLVRKRGHTVEVATFRSDGSYADGRRPTEIRPSDPRQDAERRDFTINGLFEDPATGEIVDFVGGQKDLEHRILRAIGDASARIGEDRLRMLRAIRFAARFGLSIDPGTSEAIRREAGNLRGVSRERVGNELRRMLGHPARVQAVQMLVFHGLDASVFGTAAPVRPLIRLAALPADVSPSTALAALALDWDESPDVVRRWARELVLSNAETDELSSILEIHASLRERWSGLPQAQRMRLASRPQFLAALSILLSESPTAWEPLHREVLELQRLDLTPVPLVTGEDLIRRGFRPGPAFRRVLEGVYDAQLEGRATSREAAMALAERLFEAS